MSKLIRIMAPTDFSGPFPARRLPVKRFDRQALTTRERLILQAVIYNYILTAKPVGSRILSRNFNLHLSPATIRNVMSDLEDKGCLYQPHHSAGRIPTDLGYRYYVDFMMEMEELPRQEQLALEEQITQLDPDLETLLRTTAHLLGNLTSQLGVGLAPRVSEGRLQRIEIMPLGRDKVLFIIALKSGIARTITLELGTTIPEKDLKRVAQALNQRLAGLTLREIRETIADRLQSSREIPMHVARIFVESAHRVFPDPETTDTVVVDGARNILKLPEFSESEQFRSIIELIEDKKMIVHVINKHLTQGVNITIGDEISDEHLSSCSIVTANYQVGDLHGTVGIIGPKRMNYARIISLVNFTAGLINKRLTK